MIKRISHASSTLGWLIDYEHQDSRKNNGSVVARIFFFTYPTSFACTLSLTSSLPTRNSTIRCATFETREGNEILQTPLPRGHGWDWRTTTIRFEHFMDTVRLILKEASCES